MARSVERAIRRQSELGHRIWRVVAAEGTIRNKAERPIRIVCDLHVSGEGDWGLARVADGQRGLAHRRQLTALGFSQGSVSRRVAGGKLHPILAAVFAVGHPGLEPEAAEVAVLLSVGDDCVLSHGTAAAVWGITAGPLDLVEVTVVGRGVRPRAGTRIHRVGALDSRDVRMKDNLPVTAPARTLIDWASRVSDEALSQALNQARVLGLVRDSEIEAAIVRCPTRPGVARMRRVLSAESTSGFTRSEAERRLLGLIRQAQLSPPETNARLLGYEVDCLWRAQRLVVEVDGAAFHGHRRVFERDRGRDQVLVAAGYRVIRVTWLQLEREPLAVLARIAQALGAAAAHAGLAEDPALPRPESGSPPHRVLRSAVVSELPDGIQRDFPLARLTTIRTGGHAELFARAGSIDVLERILAWAGAEEVEVGVVGSGSNLLVADEGVSGLIVKLDQELSEIELDGTRINCGGGARLPAVSARAARAGLSGIEFGVNIPGTVGGAVRMNANAYGGELARALDWVDVVNASGTERRRPEQLGFGYRRSSLAAGEIVARAAFGLEPAEPEQVKQTLADMRSRRKEAQPSGIKTFGSTFKNPTDPRAEGRSAGQLLQAAGCQGLRFGDAGFSAKHANFVENLGGATTADVVALMAEGRRRVKERFGVELEPEVQVLGPVDFPDGWGAA